MSLIHNLKFDMFGMVVLFEMFSFIQFAFPVYSNPGYNEPRL
jgi:hypothetical protein